MQAHYTATDIARLTGARLEQAGEFAELPIVQYAFDSRRISRPDVSLFLALTGVNRDGHAFARQAYDKGVRVFWTSHFVDLPADATVLLSADVLDALQRLAKYHRQQFTGTVVGITGSNGKTIVKEWLFELLHRKYPTYRSPGSFNSQLGVPLALLGINPEHHIAIIEAGISQEGEMQRLAQLVQPEVGIMTHLGRAHEQGFASFEAKVAEKAQLFASAREVFTVKHNQVFDLPNPDVQQIVGTSVACDHHFEPGSSDANGTCFSFHNQSFELAVSGEVAFENAQLAMAVAHHLGVGVQELSERVRHLQPISMRQELITDNPDITLINDAYTADVDSVYQAFERLEQDASQPHKAVILTELEEHRDDDDELLLELASAAAERCGGRVYLIGTRFAALHASGRLAKALEKQALESPQVYTQTSDLAAELQPEQLSGTTVLLKGARRFQLEQLIPLLSRQAVASYLEVDLSRLRHNLNVVRERIGSGAGIMAMLKASSYGSGGWQVAQALEQFGVEAIGVAFTGEGIALRQKGIRLPILVMNADFQSLSRLSEYDLTPAVWSFELLERLGKLGDALQIHLEFDTGMGRLGFTPDEHEQVLVHLNQYPHLQVTGVFSHLAVAENPDEDDFTNQQLRSFGKLSESLENSLGGLQKHILNTAGILRFPIQHHDLVRLGIGLYGVSPVASDQPFEEVCSLRSRISQIRTYPAGSSISYGRTTVLERDTPVATIPIGYADGMPRAASDGRAEVLIRGQRCPVLGKICMDMLMVDLSSAPQAEVGDEVLLFGQMGDDRLSINELAEAAGTIPYEILVNVSERVKRVYINS